MLNKCLTVCSEKALWARADLLLLSVSHSPLLVDLVCLLSYFSYESFYIIVPLVQLHLLHC